MVRKVPCHLSILPVSRVLSYLELIPVSRIGGDIGVYYSTCDGHPMFLKDMLRNVIQITENLWARNLSNSIMSNGFIKKSVSVRIEMQVLVLHLFCKTVVLVHPKQW